MSPNIIRNPFDGDTGLGCSWRAIRAEALRAAKLVSIRTFNKWFLKINNEQVRDKPFLDLF
jgi:hypothetical protein